MLRLPRIPGFTRIPFKSAGLPQTYEQLLSQMQENLDTWAKRYRFHRTPQILISVAKQHRYLHDIRSLLAHHADPVHRKIALKKILKTDEAGLYGIMISGVLQDREGNNRQCYILVAGNHNRQDWQVWERQGKTVAQILDRYQVIPDDRQIQWLTRIL